MSDGKDAVDVQQRHQGARADARERCEHRACAVGNPNSIRPGGGAYPEGRPWARGLSEQDQAVALALYSAGNQEFIQLHHAQALAKYRQAIQHWDHPAIRFNMAVCLINLGQPVEARDNLARSMAYEASALGPEAYAQALVYRDQLDAQLVQLTLVCPEPGEVVMLDGTFVLEGPGKVTLYLLPGDHQLVATKPGFLPASKKLTLVKGEPTTYEIRPLVDPR